MVNCPFCTEKKKNEAGLSMHIMRGHPGKWNKTLGDTIPPGFDIGKAERKNDSVFTRKGQKKKPIPSPCPFCSYKTNHPPALAIHIRSTHPGKWKTDLQTTVASAAGRSPIPDYKRPWTLTGAKKQRHLAQRRRYYQVAKKKFAAMGLSTTGKEYKPGWGPGGRSGGAPKKVGRPRKQTIGEAVRRTTNRFPIVYTPPDTFPEELDTDVVMRPRHCPNCGEDQWKWKKED